ncbi:MAG: hypothetical protein CMJ48_07105 [Planctomycetaceae bacterium]|nr:hypothetical protein [Planctomycetaceae bacterium]
MGIDDRDYLREEPPSWGPAGGSRPVWKTIIFINVVVFLLQTFTSERGGHSAINEWFALAPDAVKNFQVWRLISYGFLHSTGDIFHILFNMLFVWWFGKTIEQMYGSREFLLFYFAGLLAAGLAFMGFGLAMRDLTPAVGASGAVMAIMMLYAMHFPRHKIYIYGIIPVEIRWLVVFYVVVDAYPILGALAARQAGMKGLSDGIAHSAHLGGLMFGFLYYKYAIRLERWVGGVRIPQFGGRGGRVRRDVKIYRPEAEQQRRQSTSVSASDDQVDAILKKIHDQGEASLTDRERRILKDASERHKNR